MTRVTSGLVDHVYEDPAKVDRLDPERWGYSKVLIMALHERGALILGCRSGCAGKATATCPSLHCPTATSPL